METITPNTDIFLRHALVYLREVVRSLGAKGLQLASDWGDDVGEEDQDSWTGIYVRPAKARTDYLWLGLAADPDEPSRLWVACVGGPDALWERLKRNVPGEIVEEVFVVEDEEAGDVDDGLFAGIELKADFPADADVATIRAAARVVADGIAKSLAGGAKARKPAKAKPAPKAKAEKAPKAKAEKPAPKAAAKPAPKAAAKPAPKAAAKPAPKAAAKPAPKAKAEKPAAKPAKGKPAKK